MNALRHSVFSRRVEHFQPTVFSEISALVQMHQAVNLGQGFPDFEGPAEIKEALKQALDGGHNQYAVGQGALELRRAISEHSARFYQMQVDPISMVAVTCGATEAVFDAMMGLVDEGDEVVVFQPYYDSYEASISMAGGVLRPILLRPPDESHHSWWFDENEARAAFSNKTRVLLLNTPHNPTGKVFSRQELMFLATLCIEHNVFVVSDEVYEHLVYVPSGHIRMATLPQMAHRTLTLGSGGKSFSFTGWKVGWAIGEPTLIQALQRVHQYVTFATPAPMQLAIAAALRLPDSYFSELASSMKAKRDFLVQGLTACGLTPYHAEGSYFVMADFSQRSPLTDVEFCRWLIEQVGVAAIPPSVFFDKASAHHGRKMARFAFCKTDATLKSAVARLEKAWV